MFYRLTFIYAFFLVIFSSCDTQSRSSITDEIYVGVHDFMYDDNYYDYGDIEDMCFDCDTTDPINDNACIDFCSRQYILCMAVCMKNVSDMYFDKEKFCYKEDVERNSLYYPFSSEVCKSYENINLEKTGLTKSCSSSCADRRNVCLGSCM